MSVNVYKPHIHLISEDRANRELISGFQGHYAVNDSVLYVRTPVGGWAKVMDVFADEYLPILSKYENAHAVMLVDFDGNFESRKPMFDRLIPENFRSRAFVIGARVDPEILRQEFGLSLETIGGRLAQDCVRSEGVWDHPHLRHNRPELERMMAVIKPFLFF